MTARADALSAPDEMEIRAALDRVVASSNFRASPRLASFLRYVVEETLAGRADLIKGYNVAVSALGRRETFDPQIDPIVRVEAGRLRRALERYYAGPGLGDDLVIELPLGTYIPTFRRRRLMIGARVRAVYRHKLSIGMRHRFPAALVVGATAVVLYLVISSGQLAPVGAVVGSYWKIAVLFVAVTALAALVAWRFDALRRSQR